MRIKQKLKTVMQRKKVIPKKCLMRLKLRLKGILKKLRLQREMHIMIGDEYNWFKDKNENKDCRMNGVIHASPSRPETAPVKYPVSLRTSAGL